MTDHAEHKTEKKHKSDKTSETLAKKSPEISVAAYRQSMKANPNKRFTISPEGSTGQNFGITDKGKLIASKKNSESAFLHPDQGGNSAQRESKHDKSTNLKSSNDSHPKTETQTKHSDYPKLPDEPKDSNLKHSDYSNILHERKGKERANAKQEAQAQFERIFKPSMAIPPIPERMQQEYRPRDYHPRTKGVQNLGEVMEMGKGVNDGIGEAVKETVVQSVDYLSKHNLVSDLTKSTGEALKTAFDYYVVHLGTGDSKAILSDGKQACKVITDGAIAWSDNYSKASHYERGKQAGKLSLMFTSVGVVEIETAGAAIANTSRHLGRILSTSNKAEEIAVATEKSGIFLKAVQKLDNSSEVLGKGEKQAVFSAKHQQEMLHARNERFNFDYHSDGNLFRKNHRMLEARHSPEAVKAIDKMMEVNKTSRATTEHIAKVREAMLSLPAQHVIDIHGKGFKVHAPKTIPDIFDYVGDLENVYGCTDTVAKRVIIPEKAFANSKVSFGQLVETAGIVRHEIGHALDHTHGWTKLIKESYDNARSAAWPSYFTAADSAKTSLIEALAKGDVEKASILSERQRLFVQFHEYMDLEKGAKEVIADFYAMAHGGTCRDPLVLEKLASTFADVNSILESSNWPRKPSFWEKLLRSTR